MNVNECLHHFNTSLINHHLLIHINKAVGTFTLKVIDYDLDAESLFDFNLINYFQSMM